jgi:hypothetical protein
MKKLCAILSVICLFSFMLVSCDKTPGVSDENTKNVQQDKTPMTVEECLNGFLNSDNEEQMAQYVTQVPEGFAKSILKTFPDNDYIATAEKLGACNGYEVYSVEVKRKSDSEYIKKYFEVMKNSEQGYLIETDSKVIMDIEKECLCTKCGGRGVLSVIGKGEIPCDGCNGKIFIFE